MRWRTLALACLGLAALSAGAQVHRCKQPDGKMVYSDQPCTRSQTGGVILPDPTVREVAWEQARNRAQGAGTANSAPCRTAKEELAQLVGLRTLAPEEKRIRVQAQETRVAAACGTEPAAGAPPTPVAGKAPAATASAPVVLIYCDAGLCHDNKGGVHMKSGPDFVDPASGKRCARVGAQTLCT
ncbi:hypothetical protein PMI14_06471 [Acidovorax sp. CF316]|uniref:DUF4124 domain-containing protein n=1 Tax=Acidovorax sp. CF316 TaxID=1144317 RepID=UPI00026BC01B|nr:DUF4124 domain-containing protein [Acidovorax sp. CF316]EJE49119.1 hypothetical protein PMI14_06471 [Acidovorax sp. CF316]